MPEAAVSGVPTHPPCAPAHRAIHCNDRADLPLCPAVLGEVDAMNGPNAVSTSAMKKFSQSRPRWLLAEGPDRRGIRK